MAMRLAQALLAFASGAAGEDLHFLVMGDWGGSESSPYTHPTEVDTAASMNDAAASVGAKFTVALGDNFYSHGIKSVDDTRFATTFEQCFDGEHLSADAGHSFRFIAGNHDHKGDVQAQIDYSAKSERWNFPDFYYTFTETAPDGATVQFVLIDTVTLAGNSGVGDEDEESLAGNQLPGPENFTAAETQREWLDKTLASSTADFLIVGGHYPVYSVGDHGPTTDLSPKNFPYLQQYDVSAYLCGHDHSAQHIDNGDGVQYHVIGSANYHSGFKHIDTVSAEDLKYHEAPKGGYAVVSASIAKGMVFKHYDGTGDLRYTAPPIAPRGSSPYPTPAPTPVLIGGAQEEGERLTV